MQSLKVAFFVNVFPVLSEAFIMTNGAALLDAGCEVDIYALEGPAPVTAERHGMLQTHALEARAHVAAPPATSAWAQAPQALARAVSGLGLRAFSVAALHAHRQRGLSLRPLYEAAAFQRRGHYDILHAQFCTLAPMVLRHRRAGALRGAMITHVRGYDIAAGLAARWPKLHPEAFGGADWAIANCEYFRQRAIALGADPARTSVVPSGVRPEAFPYLARLGPSSGGARLLGVGRLVEKKGFVYALHALRSVLNGGASARLRLIGEGPERAALEREINALGLQDHVALLGARSQETIAAELAEADIFLAPCVTASDGAEDAPINVLKEAMLAGLPVVSTLHGGIPELVEHGHNGLLVPERDSDALAQAVRALLDAPQTWAAMGAAGRAAVEERYSVHASTEALFKAYEEALRAAKPGDR